MMTSIRFQITREMVDQFAELTGDHSSLHVDGTFARRSPFRRRVVHGMLPIMYLSRCVRSLVNRSNGRLVDLSVRFLKPVFPGDELELVCSEILADSAASREQQTYAYTITKVVSGESITAGRFQLEVEEAGEPTKSLLRSSADRASSIVSEALDERVAIFADLAKGEQASFPVQIGASHVAALREILALGGNSEEGIDEPATSLEQALLYAACSSTYVGMCMPGRYATYTELTSAWNVSVMGGIPATFTGEVAFLSSSTQTAVAQFMVTSADGDEILGQGKIKVRVSDPQAVMPSMAEIKQGTDLGLSDRVVLVTGASRGIGETIAKLFGAHGARVVVNYYRGREDAQRIVQEIIEAGGYAMPVQADVSDSADVAGLVEEAIQAFGPIDILINNAVGDYSAVTFQNLRWQDIQHDLDIIVKGAFNCCQAVLPAMVDRGFGRIVNLSTIAVENPPDGHARYVVAKSALLGLTRSLAVEYAARGICVNAVMPGFVETDLTSNLSKLARETMRQATPMKRHATPLDVARAVVYLASNWSAYTTGQQIAVTGGQPPFH